MAMLLCPQFTCPPQDNPFLSDEDLGLYAHAQPVFSVDEASIKSLPSPSNNSDMDGLFVDTSPGLLSNWPPFSDFLSDSSLDFQPGLVYSPEESLSPYSSNPSSPPKEQEFEDLIQVLDDNHSMNYNEPGLDPNFYIAVNQPSMPTFFPNEAMFPSPSPLSSSPTSNNTTVKKASPVLTSLLGKRPAPCDSQSAPKTVAVKQQRIRRKKMPNTVIKQRKKEQNKDAALRYRWRKKEQQDQLDLRYQVLEEKNSDLQGQVDNLTREIAYLKNLWQEVTELKQQKSRLC